MTYRCVLVRGVVIFLTACSSGGSAGANAFNDDASMADASTADANSADTSMASPSMADAISAPAGKPLGAPCVPEEEQKAAFGGFAVQEVDIIEQSSQCASGICLADHFQGRVTCPYGQSTTEAQNLAADDPKRCRTTTPDNVVGTTPVNAEVPPQLVTRRPDDVVTCSCRCAGTDTKASYCSCSAGMECVPLSGMFVDGSLSESFCIKAGTKFDQQAARTPCSKIDSDAGTDCGNGRKNP